MASTFSSSVRGRSNSIHRGRSQRVLPRSRFESRSSSQFSALGEDEKCECGRSLIQQLQARLKKKSRQVSKSAAKRKSRTGIRAPLGQNASKKRSLSRSSVKTPQKSKQSVNRRKSLGQKSSRSQSLTKSSRPPSTTRSEAIRQEEQALKTWRTVKSEFENLGKSKNQRGKVSKKGQRLSSSASSVERSKSKSLKLGNVRSVAKKPTRSQSISRSKSISRLPAKEKEAVCKSCCKSKPVAEFKKPASRALIPSAKRSIGKMSTRSSECNSIPLLPRKKSSKVQKKSKAGPAKSVYLGSSGKSSTASKSAASSKGRFVQAPHTQYVSGFN